MIGIQGEIENFPGIILKMLHEFLYQSLTTNKFRHYGSQSRARYLWTDNVCNIQRIEDGIKIVCA